METGGDGRWRWHVPGMCGLRHSLDQLTGQTHGEEMQCAQRSEKRASLHGAGGGGREGPWLETIRLIVSNQP